MLIAGGASARLAIHWAAHNAHLGLLAELLAAGVPHSILDGAKETPLHKACRGGCVEAAQALIAKGASVTAVTEAGMTPLLLAAQSGCAPLMELLLSKKANIADCGGPDGRSALEWAAAAGHTAAVRALLVAGGAAVVWKPRLGGKFTGVYSCRSV